MAADQSKNTGWVSVHRTLGSSDLWLSEKFTRGQAWIDLIMLANHKTGYIRVAGERVNIERGQCGWSKQKLAQRWRWGEGKVKRFFDEMEEDGRITQKTTNRTTITTICNYSKYQNTLLKHEAPDSGADDETNNKAADEQTVPNNNGNNENKSSPSQYFDEFWKEYPKRKGSNPIKPSQDKFKQALKKGVNPADIIAGARRYAAEMQSENKIGTEYVAQAQTWLKQARWQDYSEPPIEDAEQTAQNKEMEENKRLMGMM